MTEFRSPTSSSMAIAANRRASTGLLGLGIGPSSSGSGGSGSDATSLTPGSMLYSRRLSPGGSPSSAGSRDRYAPAVNSCRCGNLTFVVLSPHDHHSQQQSLTEGEAKAVELLFGPGDGSVGGAAAAGSIFPEGYFVGRLQARHMAQEALVHTRLHPLQSSWAIKRCLNCHLDVYSTLNLAPATGAGGSGGAGGNAGPHHRLVVCSVRALHADELRRLREADNYSRAFGLLIRAGGGGTTTSASVLSSGGALDTGDVSAEDAPNPPSGALGPALQQLRFALEHALEAERVAMETRLAQQRAQEEARLAEVEQRWRRELATVLANVEREQESGPVAAVISGSASILDNNSPRSDAFNSAARRSSLAAVRALQAGLGGTPTGADEPAEGSLIDRSMSPARALDIMTSASAAAAASRGISPLLHSRTNSRGSGSTPPTAPGARLSPSLSTSSPSDSAAALHRAAASVVAVPLDRHAEAPTTPLHPAGRRIAGVLVGNKPSSASANGHGTYGTPIGIVGSLPRAMLLAMNKNAEHMPAPPVLSASAIVSPPPAAAADKGNKDAAAQSSASSLPSAAVPGVALVPFEGEAASSSAAASGDMPMPPLALKVPASSEDDDDGTGTAAAQGEGLLTSLQHFDEFELPADGVASQHAVQRVGGGESDAIFALDEEQASPTSWGDSSLGGSPRLTAAPAPTGGLVGGGGGSTESLSTLEQRPGGPAGSTSSEDEEEFDELSEEEEEDDEEPMSAQPLSRKAAQLLGVGDGRSSRTNSASTSTTSAGIIRRSSTSKSGNSRGGGGGGGGGSTTVTVVPMSLPIQIPQQLRALAKEGKENGGKGAETQAAPTRVAHTPARANQQSQQMSGLGRSLQTRGTASVPPPAQISSRYSSDSESGSDSDSNGDGRRRGRDDGAFVPPHTLVEEPFFSFAKVRHLASPSSRLPDAEPSATGGSSGSSAARPIGSPTSSSSGGLGVAAPGASFQIPMSSSIPRVVGSLGAGRVLPPPSMEAAGAAPAASSASSSSSGAPVVISKLGFSAVNTPPLPKTTSGAAAGGARHGPSSRNPQQQQQQQQQR